MYVQKRTVLSRLHLCASITTCLDATTTLYVHTYTVRAVCFYRVDTLRP